MAFVDNYEYIMKYSGVYNIANFCTDCLIMLFGSILKILVVLEKLLISTKRMKEIGSAEIVPRHLILTMIVMNIARKEMLELNHKWD